MLYLERDIESCTLLAANTKWLYENYGSCEAALGFLSPSRREKAALYMFDKDRELSVLSSLLLDKLLRQRGLRECDMNYVVSDLGKPSFVNCPELYFSIAHSGKMAAAILGDTAVGVDLEHIADFPWDVADPFEWTEMECVGKLLGCGVGCYVDGKEFIIPDFVKTQHISFEDYLLCVAWKTCLLQLDYQAK